MFSDLIVYNYATKQIEQVTAIQYIQELMNHLMSHGINLESYNLIDGNQMYPETHNLIDQIFNYWDKDYEKIPTSNIYMSFKTIEEFIKTKDRPFWLFDKSDGSKNTMDEGAKIIKDICKLVNPKDSYNFFNAIIFTGNQYKLEYPFGVQYPWKCESGQICIIGKLDKNVIWHEIAHILGADDHYDDTTKKPKKCKDNENCFMQYNPMGKNCFCDSSIDEIKNKALSVLSKI